MKSIVMLHPQTGNGSLTLDERRSPALTRRSFLKGTAVLSGTLAIGSPLALLAPSRTWAAEMTTLDESMATKLMRLTQVIYPHENLPDAINALAVKDLDGAAAGDAGLLDAFEQGFEALDMSAGGDWMAATPDAQLAAVEANTDTILFSTVRGRAVTALYDNPLAYAHFGYEGEAFSKGGYLFRGFDDLAWLPDPPEDASPPKQ